MFSLFKKKKVKKTYNSYKVEIQPDITAREAALLAVNGFRFSNMDDRDRFYDSLPPECKRHMTRSQQEYEI